MPFLQSSGAISIGDLNSFFYGSGTSMSSFYRGVRTTASLSNIVREPSSGETYNTVTYWLTTADNYRLFIRWGNSWQVYDLAGSGGATSYTVGGYTYFRGALTVDNTGYGGDGSRYFAIYRTSTVVTQINTSIPSSGTISLGQFYGAQK